MTTDNFSNKRARKMNCKLMTRSKKAFPEIYIARLAFEPRNSNNVICLSYNKIQNDKWILIYLFMLFSSYPASS